MYVHVCMHVCTCTTPVSVITIYNHLYIVCVAQHSLEATNTTIRSCYNRMLSVYTKLKTVLDTSRKYMHTVHVQMYITINTQSTHTRCMNWYNHELIQSKVYNVHCSMNDTVEGPYTTIAHMYTASCTCHCACSLTYLDEGHKIILSKKSIEIFPVFVCNNSVSQWWVAYRICSTTCTYGSCTHLCEIQASNNLYSHGENHTCIQHIRPCTCTCMFTCVTCNIVKGNPIGYKWHNVYQLYWDKKELHLVNLDQCNEML